MRTVLAAALGAAFFVAAAPAAHGQAACGDRAEILAQLARMHGEWPRAIGRLGNGNVIELLVADNGGWTMIVTTPAGTTCAVAAGDSWTFTPVPPERPRGRGS